MHLRQHNGPRASAAKAGLSTATAYRVEDDPRLPSAKKKRRGRHRAHPLAGIFDEEVVPMLEQAPDLRTVGIFEELMRRHTELGRGVRRTLERACASGAPRCASSRSPTPIARRSCTAGTIGASRSRRSRTRRWKAMLDAGVFPSQSELANDLGCHRARNSRGVRAATTLLGEEGLAGLVLPAMHEFTGRSAFRLADALENPARRHRAQARAEDLEAGTVPAHLPHDALLGDTSERPARDIVFLRRKGRSGYGETAVVHAVGGSGADPAESQGTGKPSRTLRAATVNAATLPCCTRATR